MRKTNLLGYHGCSQDPILPTTPRLFPPFLSCHVPPTSHRLSTYLKKASQQLFPSLCSLSLLCLRIYYFLKQQSRYSLNTHCTTTGHLNPPRSEASVSVRTVAGSFFHLIQTTRWKAITARVFRWKGFIMLISQEPHISSVRPFVGSFLLCFSDLLITLKPSAKTCGSTNDPAFISLL